MPVFLSNFEFFSDPVLGYPGEELERDCLTATMLCPAVNRWLDQNLVKGNAGNQTTARRVLGHLMRTADFSLLASQPNSKASAAMRETTIRVKKVLAACEDRS